MRKTSKILAWLLTIAMVLSLVPTVAFATEPAEATLTFDDTAKRTVFTTEQQVWEENGVRVVNDKASSTTSIADYANPVRFYKNSTVTVSYTSGKIAKIVFVCGSASYANTLASSIGADAVAEGTAVTYTLAEAAEEVTVTLSGGQVRMSSLTVTYVADTGTEPTEDPDPTEEPTEAPTEPEPTVVPVSEALAGSDGTSFMVKGVVTLVEGSNIYVQDETGGICVRMSSAPSDIALGDTIIGTGSKTSYRGMSQLDSGTYEKSEGMTLTAKETTIDALTTADVCTYVQINGLEVTEVYDNSGDYTNPNITLTDGTNTIQIYKAVVAKTDGTNWDIQVGDTVNVSAAVGINNTTLQLRNTLASEITVVEAAPEPTDPEPTDPEPTEPEVTEPGDTTEATLTFDDTAKRTSFSAEQQIWEENGVKAVNDKASSTSSIADYANPVRFYKNSTLTISCASGKIAKIVFTCSTASYANNLATSIGTDAVAEDTAVTYTLPETAAEVTITLSGGQVRLNSLTVTYVADTGSEPTEPKNGIVEENGELHYYIDGEMQMGLGLILLDGSYYYIRTSGACAVGEYWITNTNGLLPQWVFTFGEDGKMIDPPVADGVVKNGIVQEEDGLYYYVNGIVQWGAGYIEIEGSYYYVRSNGACAIGQYWVTNTNGLVEEGLYNFGEDGKLIP